MPRKKTTKQMPRCPECGSVRIVEDVSRGELTCLKCGLVIKEDMIDTGQEWRAFDSEQISRRARGGAPLTFSVDYSEPIVIKEDNELRVVKIGEFIDEMIAKNKDEVKKQGILEVLSLKKDIKTVSFDEDYKITFKKITEVSRHPVDEIYEITMESGKKIKVTGSHSVFTVNEDNMVVPVYVDQLQVGQFLVAPSWIPSSSANLELDLVRSFSSLDCDGNIYLRHISNQKLFEKLSENSKQLGVKKDQIKNWRRHKTLPIAIFQSMNLKPNGEKIGIYSSPVELPTKLEITKEFCKLLGYYVAEGSCTEYGVNFSFSSSETEKISELKNLVSSTFGINVKEYNHGSSTQLEIDSKLISILFSQILKCGKNSHEKRIPPIIFNLPVEMKLEFLKGYIGGDGCVWRREGTRDTQVSAVSVSEDLMDDLSILYLQLGIHANYVKAKTPSHVIQKTGQILPESVANILRITNPDAALRLGFIQAVEKRKRKGAIEDLIPAPVKYKKEWKSRKRVRIGRDFGIKIAEKYGDEKLLKLAKAPFIFLRVKKIEKIKPTKNYAYDLTVPGFENFASKVFLHNTKHDKGLTTEIGKGLGELYKVPTKKRAQYYRLTKWHKRLIKSKDRNLSFALSELQRIVSFLNLPRGIHERIARYYEEAVNKGLVRGRSIESVIASLIYAVSREFGSPRTLDEISEASGVEKREIGRTYRYIARELQIRILPADPMTFVPRFCSMLGLSDRVQAKAAEILRKAKKHDITSGKGPTGVAAAAIYIACVLVGEKRTQREVADIVGVTEVTIRNRYKELVEKLGIEEEVEKKAKEE